MTTMIVNRAEIETYDSYDRDIDSAIEDVLEDRQVEKVDKSVGSLNDIGRKVLNAEGATLELASRKLAELLDTTDEDEMVFKVSKFLVERHSGRLEGSKEDNSTVINVIVGEGIRHDEPNIFNPAPIDIKHEVIQDKT